MNLNDELKALARYRFEQSKECINSAKVLRDCGDYKGAANRSYYAFFFHAMRSVFALYNSDYDDFYVVSKSDVDEQIKNAEQFTLAIMMFLESKGVEITK